MSSSRRSRFAIEISDPDAGLACDLTPESDVMMIAFGGKAGRLGIAPFEFLKVVDGFGVKKVFLRDRHRSWYHQGVDGVGTTIDAVAGSLARLVADNDVRRTVALGNSAGAYGALLFGHLLAVDEVHAFSPQAFIDREMLHAIGDRRWDDMLDVLERSCSSAIAT